MQSYLGNYNAIASDDLKADIMSVALKEAQADKAVSYAGSVWGRRVLDIGVGKGILLGRCDGAFKVGIDIAPAYLQYSWPVGHMVRAFGEHLPFKPESFDVIFMTDVLEHVICPADLMKSAMAVLMKTGVVVVRVPNREDLRTYKDSPYEFAHLRSFDRKSLGYFLKRCGLKPTRVEYDSFVNYRPSTLTRWVRKVGRALQMFGVRVEVTGKGNPMGVAQTVFCYWFDHQSIDLTPCLCRLPNWIGKLVCRPVEIAMVCRRAG